MSDELPPGAHLVSSRGWYEHHGIHLGGGRVAHYAGFCYGFHSGPVEEVSLEQFAAGRGFEVRTNVDAAFTPTQVVQRARSRIGERRYNLLANNCEHFCEWAINGRGASRQVERLLSAPGALVRRFRDVCAQRLTQAAV